MNFQGLKSSVSRGSRRRQKANFRGISLHALFQQKQLSAEGNGGVNVIIQMHTEGTISKAGLGVVGYILESIICHVTATIRLDYVSKTQQFHLTLFEVMHADN